MKLSELLKGVAVKNAPNDCEIISIATDTGEVTEGSLFVCLEGKHTDGHCYVGEAVNRGAVAVVCSRELCCHTNSVIVNDTRVALSVIAANFYGNPQNDLKLVGVTGTNGKTTVTHIMKHILLNCGKNSGIIGTIENLAVDNTFPSSFTTPSPMELYKIFREMANLGCEYVVMEVSSQGLSQLRTEGLMFEVAVFLNLTQDHLDYHGSMEEYYSAKRKLFDCCKTAVVNIDDSYGKRLFDEVNCEKYSFSAGDTTADYTAHAIKKWDRGVSFAYVGNSLIKTVQLMMPGDHSVSNALAAVTACYCLGLPISDIAKAVGGFEGVSGRYEHLVSGRGYNIVRDYAHSPDSLMHVVKTAKAHTDGTVYLLFGCGGDRDRTKRPIMGELAAEYADFLIVTSDNPRSEDPDSIIDDILVGVVRHKTPYKRIGDRKSAIAWGIEQLKQGDTLILAGKGHECYQILRDGRIDFDEKQIVLSLLEEC